jgi:hypothetical protein
MSFWVGVVNLIVGTITIITIFYGVFKIVNRNEREWQQREDRLIEAEKAIVALQADVKILTGIDVQIKEMKAEIERMRNRLDRFLDMQSGSRAV